MAGIIRSYYNAETNFFFSTSEKWQYVPAAIKLIEWPDLIHIYGAMPNCAALLEFKNGETIEILWDNCMRDFHASEDAIFRLSNCRIERMWIDDPIAIGIDEVGPITLNLRIHADIKFLGNDELADL